MKVMIIYLADFRDAPDDDRRVDIINRALEEMDTIGAPAPFPAQATRVTVGIMARIPKIFTHQ